MERNLEKDLKRLEGMAFGRLKHCGPLLRRFHELRETIEETERAELIWNVYDWLLTPFMIWPLDFEGLAEYLLERLKAEGQRLKWNAEEEKEEEERNPDSESGLRFAQEKRRILNDDKIVLLLEILPEPPSVEEQEVIAEFEREVESGRYERMLKQAAKYDEREKALMGDGELSAVWRRIKENFDPGQYQNSRGVIRRRMSQERNFRAGWEFDWEDARSQFGMLFDAMCYRWRLYGMEKDRPLLLKVSVNPTPHGTMIVIPRYLSLDPRRDLDWKLIGRLHRCRGAEKQGPKLSAGRMARLEEAQEAKRLWAEAKRKGKKGEARYEYVRERMGRDERANPGWLKRLLNF